MKQLKALFLVIILFLLSVLGSNYVVSAYLPAQGLVVAAADSPDYAKAGADYLCDGTADDVEVQDAVTRAGATGGIVILAPGTFNFTTSVIAASGVTIIGTPPKIENITNPKHMPDMGFMVTGGTIIKGNVLCFVGPPKTEVYGFNLRDLSFKNVRGIIRLGENYYLGGGFCDFTNLYATNTDGYVATLGANECCAIKLINCQHVKVDTVHTFRFDRAVVVQSALSNDPTCQNPFPGQAGCIEILDVYGNPAYNRTNDGVIKAEALNMLNGTTYHTGQTLAWVNIVRPQINNAGNTPNTAAVSLLGSINKVFTSSGTTALTPGDTCIQATTGAVGTVEKSTNTLLAIRWSSGTHNAVDPITDQHNKTFGNITGTTPSGLNYTKGAYVTNSSILEAACEGGEYTYLARLALKSRIEPDYIIGLNTGQIAHIGLFSSGGSLLKINDTSAVISVSNSSPSYLTGIINRYAGSLDIYSEVIPGLYYVADTSLADPLKFGGWQLFTSGEMRRRIDFVDNTGGNNLGTMTGSILAQQICTVTGTRVMNRRDMGIVLINAANPTIFLPSAATCAGGSFQFKKIHPSSAAVTLRCIGTDTLDGTANNSEIYSQYDTMTVFSDGTQWFILNKKVTAH